MAGWWPVQPPGVKYVPRPTHPGALAGGRGIVGRWVGPSAPPSHRTATPSSAWSTRRCTVSPGRDGGEEVDIVESTWSLAGRTPAADLELVAVEGGNVVGHALGAPPTSAGGPSWPWLPSR